MSTIEEKANRFPAFVEKMARRCASEHESSVVAGMEAHQGFHLAITANTDFAPLVAAWMAATGRARYACIVSGCPQWRDFQFERVRQYLLPLWVGEKQKALYLEDAKIDFLVQRAVLKGSRYKDTRPDLLIIDETVSLISETDKCWFLYDLVRATSSTARILEVRDR